MISIIDIGTNTIRLVTYNDKKIIFNIAVRSEIIRDTKDGELTSFGTENLCNILKFLISKTEAKKIYIVATRSLRVLKNKEEVSEKIFEETGIEIDILTGEEEAECAFLGAKSKIEENNGIIIDLGGGSCEIIAFEKEKIKFLKSYPIGTKVIKNKFSKRMYPNEEEAENIKTYLTETVEKQATDGKIYITGGTAKTALSLYNGLTKEEKTFITIKEIEEILNFIKGKNEEELKKLFSTRYDTISVGIIIIKTLAEIFEKEEIYIVNAGVREGYLIKRDEIIWFHLF